MIKNKKAMLESTLGKVIFGLIVIVVVIGIILIFTGKLGAIWDMLARVMRFG